MYNCTYFTSLTCDDSVPYARTRSTDICGHVRSISIRCALNLAMEVEN